MCAFGQAVCVSVLMYMQVTGMRVLCGLTLPCSGALGSGQSTGP